MKCLITFSWHLPGSAYARVATGSLERRPSVHLAQAPGFHHMPNQQNERPFSLQINVINISLFLDNTKKILRFISLNREKFGYIPPKRQTEGSSDKHQCTS
jgi:hypothetical protein